MFIVFFILIVVVDKLGKFVCIFFKGMVWMIVFFWDGVFDEVFVFVLFFLFWMEVCDDYVGGKEFGFVVVLRWVGIVND